MDNLGNVLNWWRTWFTTISVLCEKRDSKQSFWNTIRNFKNDAYLNAQVGAVTRGTYTLKIVEVLFVKNFVPVSYLQPNAPVFDFADMDNDAATQLFNEVVSSLSAAFSNYTNDPNKGNRITKIQGDQIGFAQFYHRQ